MKTIYLHHPYNPEQIPLDDVVLVLGFFDGVHKGHQKVIAEGLKIAKEKNLPLALLTFNQHASKICQKSSDITYLTTFEQKKHILEEMGVDYLYQVQFTSAFSKLAPQDFVLQYIIHLHAKVVVAGFDYTYGPKEIATMDKLPIYSNDEFEIVTVDNQKIDDEKISSTRIRKHLNLGELDVVTELLGRVYSITGEVIHGEARGKTLGFPTANLKIDLEMTLPKPGIYAVKVIVNDKTYLGMANIGHNVTFGLHPLSVEVNILDFDEDIYGENVEVFWYQRLRDEIKFSHVNDLIDQLNQDRIDTYNYFKERV